MSRLTIKQFTHVEALQKLEPGNLLALLKPFHSYLSSVGISLPTSVTGTIPYDQIVEQLVNPSPLAPPDFVLTFYFVDEISSEESIDRLIDLAKSHGIPIHGTTSSAIDIAAQLWLADPKVVERKHAELASHRGKKFIMFRGARPRNKMIPVTLRRLSLIESSLDATFDGKGRGKHTSLYHFPTKRMEKFMLRHGEPFRREESAHGKSTHGIAYRPVSYDVIIFDHASQHLLVRTRTKWERLAYATEFGRLLFDDPYYFAEEAVFTLAPLIDYGAVSLSTGGIEGIESVKLTKLLVDAKDAYGLKLVYTSDDIFASLELRRTHIRPGEPLLSATFEFTMTKGGKAYPVRLDSPNTLIIPSGLDRELVERFFLAKGFMILHEQPRNQPAKALVELG